MLLACHRPQWLDICDGRLVAWAYSPPIWRAAKLIKTAWRDAGKKGADKGWANVKDEYELRVMVGSVKQ